jgi:Flp pilus assembly secretin CpaC
LKYKSINPVLFTISMITVLLFLTMNLHAQEQLIRVVKGKSTVIKYPEKIKTVSLANDDIADVVSITPTTLVVIGKEEGITSLIVWGESEKLTNYEIKVDRNTTGQQVVLEVKVAEVNKTALAEYGLDVLMLDFEDSFIGPGTKVLGSYAGGVTSPDPLSEQLFVPDGASIVARYLGNDKEISVAIKAMQRKGDLELLANPRLLCLSGENASFLVGGEIPIPVAQSVGAGGIPSVTIEWKEFGVMLNFVPTIIDTNLINLRIMPEVSSLDYTNAVSYAGYDIPALRTRKADATLELNSGQSIVMGGLLSRESFKTVKRVPLLGHIPILGYLFSQTEKSSYETELLIIVSPRIITSVENEVIPPLPFEKNKEDKKGSTRMQQRGESRGNQSGKAAPAKTSGSGSTSQTKNAMDNDEKTPALTSDANKKSETDSLGTESQKSTAVSGSSKQTDDGQQ